MTTTATTATRAAAALARLDLDAEDRAVALYRALHPASRATSTAGYSRNTSRRRERTCLLCRDWAESWCAAWPRTDASRSREWAHARACAPAYLAATLAALAADWTGGAGHYAADLGVP